MFGSIPLVKGNPTVSQLRPLEHVCQQEQELSMKGITELQPPTPGQSPQFTSPRMLPSSSAQHISTASHGLQDIVQLL